jgi:hypothetical protein
LGVAVGGQLFVTAMPTAVVDRIPLPCGMLLSDKVVFHRCWLRELAAQGVTGRAVPKDPV